MKPADTSAALTADIADLTAAVLVLAEVQYVLSRPGTSITTAENIVLERWRSLRGVVDADA